MTIARDTPRTLQRAGSSSLLGYRFRVTEAEQPTREARAAQRRQAEAEQAREQAIIDRNAAIVKMAEAGLSPLAISRELTHGEFKMSTTNVRQILKIARGPRKPKDGSGE